MADSGSFGADSEELRRAGVDIVKLSGINERILGELLAVLNTHQARALGTGGEITEALLKNYVPGAKGGVKILELVAALLEANGLQTVDLGSVVGGADDDTTTITQGRK